MVDTPPLTDYLKSLTLVAFDTETTGLWAPSNRIVELGGVKFNLIDGELESFQSLVNPAREMPPEVIRVHGITDEMVAEAPMIGPVLEQFIRFCGTDSILVAHNAPFDIAFVGCELDRVGRKFGENLILDTVEIYRTLFPGLVSYSLLSLSKQFEIAIAQTHRALDDARLVAGLVRHAAAKFPPVTDNDELQRAMTCYQMDDWHSTPELIPDEFKIVHEAQQSGSRLQIVYSSPDKPDHSRIVQVKNIFQLNTKFYMNAYCERVQAERTFRLDRIRSAELVGNKGPGENG